MGSADYYIDKLRRYFFEEISMSDEEIHEMLTAFEALADGSCRFNCRTMRESFNAGYLAAQSWKDSREAYEEWRRRE